MPDTDVASILHELERKLRELEEELQAPSSTRRVGAAPPSPAADPDPTPTAVPVPAPATQSAPAETFAFSPAEPSEPLAPAPESVQEQLDELLRFRSELERSEQELMAEYERFLGALRIADPTPPATGLFPSPPPITPETAPAPPTNHVSLPPEPWQPAPAPVVADLDDAVMDGAITVDAGPFTDITALTGFEQALGAVPGVRDVYVRGFEGRRAMIDVTLSRPVALGTELRRVAPVAFSITAADAGRLSVAVQGA